MGLKTIHSVTNEVSTSDDNWTTVATYAVTTDCNILIRDIFVQGRATNGTAGETANATAEHRGKRVGGVLTLVQNILFILSFVTGSDAALISCDLQVVTSGNNITLQVKGIAGRNIVWYGGFTVILN